jgi:hypothetical protein
MLIGFLISFAIPIYVINKRINENIMIIERLIGTTENMVIIQKQTARGIVVISRSVIDLDQVVSSHFRDMRKNKRDISELKWKVKDLQKQLLNIRRKK